MYVGIIQMTTIKDVGGGVIGNYAIAMFLYFYIKWEPE